MTLLFVCFYVYALTVARQWLGEHVPAATNTHAKVEEVLYDVRIILKESRFFCG
jgi:hypothetical protein